jgi:hypothetical protein
MRSLYLSFASEAHRRLLWPLQRRQGSLLIFLLSYIFHVFVLISLRKVFEHFRHTLTSDELVKAIDIIVEFFYLIQIIMLYHLLCNFKLTG